MSDLPKRVQIREEGPREGFQIERVGIPTEDKVRLVDALSETGLDWIQVTSFVSPKWVPQMADAEEMSQLFKKKEGIEYTALYLNEAGARRAVQSGKYNVVGDLITTASNKFSLRNTNRDIEQTVAHLPRAIETYKELGLPINHGYVMAAFGCNFQGDVPLEQVMWLIDKQVELGQEYGFTLEEVTLADTMGWANPEQIKRMVGAVRNKYPDLEVSLHLHDTRGLAIANTYAALQMGITKHSTSIGGLGGCPFAGHAGAAGNMVTEDLVFMCHEMGIETGVDLDKVIEVGLLAEEIVGHPLPGKVMKGGNLNKFRPQAATVARQ